LDSVPWNLLFEILYDPVTYHTCASCEKRCVNVAEGTIMIVVAGSWNCSGGTSGSWNFSGSTSGSWSNNIK
jgi:hypothetical protein